MPKTQPKKVKAVKAVRAVASKESSADAPQPVRASNVLTYDDLEYRGSPRERHWVSETRKKRFYESWWFWTALFVLVAAGIILTGLW